VAGDVDRFSDEEQAGHIARFHRPRLKIACVHAARGHFGFLEAFRSDGMKLPLAQLPLAGFQRSIRPAQGSSLGGEKTREPLGQNFVQRLPERKGIPASAVLKQGL
jgi:hypothetical protein